VTPKEQPVREERDSQKQPWRGEGFDFGDEVFHFNDDGVKRLIADG
jgi:hypothetical protein